MSEFCQEKEGIYRLKIPFDTVYTSVFLIVTEEKRILVDCAATSSDVDIHIAEACRRLGYPLSEINTLVLTHRHGDHAGGKARISELAPTIEIVTDVRELTDQVSTYPMAGHTEDCIGVLDTRTNTLLSGDSIQGAGVDKYRLALESKTAYQKTLERLKNDQRIENILFSHAYEPWYCDRVEGRESVLRCLEECEKYL